MTATDELRRLLDERGVEWKADTSVINGVVWTIWKSPWFGETWAKEVDGSISLFNCSITPEQAVEATLGSELKAENAKLRELVRCLIYATRPSGRATLIANAADMLAELGIEVDA